MNALIQTLKFWQEAAQGIKSQVESLAQILNSESSSIQNQLRKINEEINEKVASGLEQDITFLRTDIAEFRENSDKIAWLKQCKQARKHPKQICLICIFSITEFDNQLTKKISEISSNLSGISNSTEDNLNSTEIIKNAILDIASWIDKAENLLFEINDMRKIFN
ncbi:MAG: hypothetical protein MZU97_01885 [Bacillus subtilis]|nr:hypothetical protein [Bacillus subtilis]